MLHVKTVDAELVASDKPRCVACSKLILDAGITTMWLHLAGGWRSYTAAEFHARSLANSDLPTP
jgi:deoxycytidylate deaminase